MGEYDIVQVWFSDLDVDFLMQPTTLKVSTGPNSLMGYWLGELFCPAREKDLSDKMHKTVPRKLP